MGLHKWSEVPTTVGARRRHCPPHGPLLAEAARESAYVIKCLSCGLCGPEREDALAAMLAFEQEWTSS